MEELKQVNGEEEKHRQRNSISLKTKFENRGPLATQKGVVFRALNKVKPFTYN